MTFPRGSLAAAVLLTLAGRTLEAVAAVQDPPAVAAHESYSSKRFVEVPIDRSRLSGKKGLELWVSADAGQTWVNHGEVDPTKPGAAFLAPRDGRYGFQLVPVGEDGRRDVTPKTGDAPEKTVVVDTQPPVVEVLAPNGGEIFGSARSTLIQWAAADANLDQTKGITIEVSTGKDTWIPVAQNVPNTGKYHWDIPAALSSMTCRVKVVARDLAGNVASDMSDADFIVDGLPPELRISGPMTANEVPVKIEWTGGDLGGSGLKRVSLWTTRDGGQTWKLYGDDPGLKSPFFFTDLDGIYGLKLVGEDKMGNANPSPLPGMPPLFSLTLDRTKPEVRLISPKPPGYLGGVAMNVQWTAKDNIDMPANGIALSWSDDGGKTWKDIGKGLKNDGLYSWTPPRASLPDCRLKIVAADFAGNVREVVSERFGIDGSVPEARATGPDRSNAAAVPIAYEIRNRGSLPIKSVSLYYRAEGVKEWAKYGDDPDLEPPFSFAKTDGKYGIYITCATEAGLQGDFAQKAPDKDTEPQLTLIIDSLPPQLELTSFNDGPVVMAGAAADISWKMTEANPDPKGMSIYHSPDGGKSWNLVGTNLDSLKGSYRWSVPNASGARHKVRLVCVDRFGNRGQVESAQMFTIDNDLPIVGIVERPPLVTRTPRIAVKYKATDLTSGVDKVALHGRVLTEKGTYKLLAESKNAEGTLEAELPAEGSWGLILVAHDGAGHASADAERNPRPDMVTMYDATKPEISLRSFLLPEGGRTWLNPSWEIEWVATDKLSPVERIVIRIEYSTDGGRTWFVAVPRHNNAGRADLRSLLFQGKKVRLRVIAVDEAGNEAEDVSGDFDPGDVPAPSLTLRGIEDGRPLVAGTIAPLSWSSPDHTVMEATLELSRDGGKTWAFYSALGPAQTRVTLPAEEGRYQIRASAKDAANRPVSSNVITFDAMTGLEPVRIIANASVEPGGLVAAVIEPKSILKSAEELRLELSDGGLVWTPLAEVKETSFTFKAPAKPGEYQVRILVRDAKKREYDSNHFRFQVLGKMEGLRLNNFRGGESMIGGTSRPIMIQTSADLAKVKVEFSDASGKEGSWKPVTDLTRLEKGLLWTLPRITSSSCRLRISATDGQGRPLADASDRDFKIETGETAIEIPVKPATDVQLQLKSAIPDRVKGGTKLRLEWAAGDPAAKVTIALSVEGNSGVLFKDQGAIGALDFVVPKIDSKDCQIALTSGDQKWTSRTFEIISHPPAIDGVDIELPRK
ncbi:MAG TPA: hypothetical protein VKU80_14425 [Planctomycetota bacterium]|nr:hypothetical protein [Planctomycetota bacterium]